MHAVHVNMIGDWIGYKLKLSELNAECEYKGRITSELSD